MPQPFASPAELAGSSEGSLRAEIAESLEIFPRREALKRVFWEILGFDPARLPIDLGRWGNWVRETVERAELFGRQGELRVALVTLASETVWRRGPVNQIAGEVAKEWPQSLVLVTDEAEMRWVLGRRDAVTGRTQAVPLFDAGGEAATLLAALASGLEEVLDESALAQDEKVAQAFQAANVDRALGEWLAKVGAAPDTALALWFKEMARWSLWSWPEQAAAHRELERLWPRPRLEPMPKRRTKAHALAAECVCRNLRLVAWLARRYHRRMGPALETLDLLQEGTLGLMAAVRKFEVERGFRFSTYAFHWIRQAITRHIDDCVRTIRVPVHICERIRRWERMGWDGTSAYHPVAWEADPRFRDWHRMPLLRMTIEDLRVLEERSHLEARAMSSTWVPRTQLEAEQRQRAETVRQVLAGLGDRQRFVLERRFGLNGSVASTLEEIALTMGVTRERVRQIEAKAFLRLRHPARRRRLIAHHDGLE